MVSLTPYQNGQLHMNLEVFLRDFIGDLIFLMYMFFIMEIFKCSQMQGE